jgi:hypothetical protein
MKAADMDTPLAVKFLTAGTAACVADAVSFPLDTAKVRLQVCVCVRKTKYVFVSCQQNAGQNDNTKIADKSFQNVEKFKYLRKTLPNKNCMHEEIKSILKSGNACYHSVWDILSSFSPSRSIKIKMQYMELYFCVFCMGVKLGTLHYSKYVF